MTQRVAILNGENINYDKDFSELAMSTDGVIRGLVVTPTSVSAGKAWVKVSRDTVTPKDEFLVLFESTESVSISTTNNQYIIVEVDDTQIQTGGVEEDGTGIGEIKVVNTLPTVNYIELARTDGSGTVITTNRKISTTIATVPHSVEYVNGDGERVGVPLGTAGQTLVSKGPTSAPEFESPAVDIGGLTESTTSALTDFYVLYNGTNNRKISQFNIIESLFVTNGTQAVISVSGSGAGTWTSSETPTFTKSTIAILASSVNSQTATLQSWNGATWVTVYSNTGVSTLNITFLLRAGTKYRYHLTSGTGGSSGNASLTYTV